MLQTTNYNLKKIELTDSPPDITVINPNWDSIDAEMKSLRELNNSLAAYAVAIGTNTYIATIAGITALTEGFSIKIKFTNANTGSSTLNINGLGVKSILKGNGSALSSGNIKAGQICNLVYGGVNFQLLGEGGEYGTATASDVLSGKTIGTDGGLVTGTIPSKGTQTYTPGTVNQSISAGQYLSGIQTISGDADLVSANIKAGANIFNVEGKLSVVDTADATIPNEGYIYSGVSAYKNGAKLIGTMPVRGALNAIPNAGNQSFPFGYYDSVTVNGVTNLIAENIKSGVNVGGVVGSLVPAPNIATTIFDYTTNEGNKNNAITGSTVYSATAVTKNSIFFTTSSGAFTITASDTVLFTNRPVAGGTPIRTVIGTSYNVVVNDYRIFIYNPKKSTVTIPAGVTCYTYID